jgi:aminoglycoside/choline kinase family phosphotransferase
LTAQAEEVCDDWSPIQGDASYRRYFRVRVNGESRILMDSPPNLENASPFVDIAGRLRAAGLHAPEIFLADLEAGFLLLEDLGDALFRDLIDDHSVDALFAETFSAMAQMVHEVSHEGLPAFDRDTLRGELNGFTRYYLDRERGHIWNSRQHDRWDAFCAVIVARSATTSSPWYGIAISAGQGNGWNSGWRSFGAWPPPMSTRRLGVAGVT